MTIPNVEPAVEQQQSQQQQQEYNYTKRDYKKRQSVTKHKRGGGNSYGRYRDEFSRYSSYKELPRYAVPSYVYYYPPSVYYPPSSAFDSSTTYNHVTTRDDEDLEIIMHEESMNNTSSVDRRRISDQAPFDLKKQLEFYFSRQNLVNDTYLVSQMDSDLYVPISLVANFRRVREWTTDMNTIVKTLRDSTAVTVDESGTKVKPNISVQRNTVIWRDVPECTEQEINDLLKELNSPSVQSIKQDIGNMWYFTFESEDDALKLLLSVRGKSFKGQAIAARMKSEPLIRVQSRPSAATNVPPPSINQEAAMPQQPLMSETMFPYNNNHQYSYPATITGYRNTYPQNNNKRNNYQHQTRQQPSSPTRLYNHHYNYNNSNNSNYYHGNANRNSYEKNQQIGGRSPRGGYKSKYHFNNKSERFSSESETNLETNLANVSISDGQQQERQYHYQPRQHYNQHQPRHHHNNKYHSNNKNKLYSTTSSYHSNKYQTHQQHHNTNTTTTNEEKKEPEVDSTSTVEIEAELDQSQTKQTSQDSTRKTETTCKSKKKGNHGNGSHSNTSYGNEINHGNGGGDKQHHNSNRKKKKNTSSNNSERVSDKDLKVIELKPTHFPPLPNQQPNTNSKPSNETIPNTIISNNSESSVGTAPPTRSAADIVKANAKAPLKNKKKQQTYVPNSTKKPEDEKKQLDLPASENEAFPSLCQTTEFKSTAFSYADILKKKEQQQQSEQQ